MFARRMAPSLRIGNPAAPFILSPLICAAQARTIVLQWAETIIPDMHLLSTLGRSWMWQVIHIAKEGEEPALTDYPKEDMALQRAPSSAGVP